MRNSKLKFLAAILASLLLAGSVFAGIDGPPYNPANVAITGGAINGTPIGATSPGTGAFSTLSGYGLYFQGSMVLSGTIPLINAGFGTNAAITQHNGGTTFRISTGTTGLTSTGQIDLRYSGNWNCLVEKEGFTANQRTIQSASSGQFVTFTNYTVSTGAAVNWPSGAVLLVHCSRMYN